MSAKRAKSDNESFTLELFYEYFSLCLFAGKKTIIRFRKGDFTLGGISALR